MQSEWEEVKLSEITIRITKGTTPSKKDGGFSETGINYIKAESVGFDGRIDSSKFSFISNDVHNKLKRSQLQSQDILFSMAGVHLGKSGIVEEEHLPANTNQALSLIRPNQDLIFPKYLHYFLQQRSVVKFVNNSTSQSAQPNINLAEIGNLVIRFPELSIQKKITHILSTLDDKIELNRKMNQTLEEMAQALFKSWFVDFNPVHAKADAKSDEALERAAVELGIAREVLELFPSEFEESELGMIPKGWEVKPFGELLSKTIGGDWGKEEPDDKHTEKVKIIRGTDIPKIKNISIEAVPTRYVEVKKLKTRELFDGDIVIEVSGGTKNQPTGRTLYVTTEILEMLGNKVEPASFCRLFRPINMEVGLILGQHMLYIYDQGKTWQYQNQSTGISNFQTTIFLEKEHVIVPDAKVLAKFYDIVRPIVEKSLSSENITLQKTRDTLLPKLLSGELDVSNINMGNKK